MCSVYFVLCIYLYIKAYVCLCIAAQNALPSDQLSLALAWNRVDIARGQVFTANDSWKVMIRHMSNENDAYFTYL